MTDNRSNLCKILDVDVESNQFPSIKNGESYTYEEIIGGNY